VIQNWQRWNKGSRKWLWILVIVGIIAAIPVMIDRVKTETSSNKVEVVFNFRGLLEISALKENPERYLDHQLTELQAEGVTTMAMFESTLDEMVKAHQIMSFSSLDLAKMNQDVLTGQENKTYIAFTSAENEKILSPIIQQAFRNSDISVSPWKYENYTGLEIGAAIEEANLKVMPSNPILIAQLHERGFNILPRMSDSSPYNQREMDDILSQYKQLGVTKILFDGEAVKGFNDNEKMNSLQGFAELLKKYDIGIVTIENLKKPQKGFSKLAYLIDYNVVRLFSLSDVEGYLKPDVLADKFVLATKDRNIRMIYLNALPTVDVLKASVTNPVNNLLNALGEPENAIQSIEKNGFEIGQAHSFTVYDSAWQKYCKAVVVVGAVAFIALLVSYFAFPFTLLAFILGMIGSAGLYVLKPALMEQGLALLVSISAPTIAVVLAIRKVEEMQGGSISTNVGRRIAHSLVLYFKTALISLAAAPFIIALLNNISYSLVITQFRGVSLLHLIPIMLIALYVFLYLGKSVWQELQNWLKTPITLLWVVLFVVLAGVAYFYLSRTGNGGTLLPGEAQLRSFLENNFGVRPRNKEFLFAHPVFLAGVFAAFRYRKALYAMIIVVIGQLSMVDTFAHIHTPMVLSLIRGVLGLGLGLIVGFILLLVWYIVERCWDRWSPRLLKKL
jgi:hypothetical protein